MKYLLMLMSPEDYSDQQMSQEEFEAEMERYNAFGAYLDGRGKPYTGEALLGPKTAKTVRLGDDGSLTVTDGPFADLKETVGGFYIIEAESIEDAVEVARHCPNDRAVEVRQIWEFEEFE